MIVVKVYHEEDSGELNQLGEMRISREYNLNGFNDPEVGQYSVGMVISRSTAVGIHRRAVRNFPRLTLNAFALVKEAFNQYDADSLCLEESVATLSEAEPPFNPKSILRRMLDRF